MSRSCIGRHTGKSFADFQKAPRPFLCSDGREDVLNFQTARSHFGVSSQERGDSKRRFN